LSRIFSFKFSAILEQETEKQALKSALVEERSRYCLFVACLKPVMVKQSIPAEGKCLDNLFYLYRVKKCP
jgi:hypothetical protein